MLISVSTFQLKNEQTQKMQEEAGLSQLCEQLHLGEEELGFVDESDLQALPPNLRRKLLIVAARLRRGNSLDGVKNLGEVTGGGDEVVRLDVGGHKFTTLR